MANIYKAKLTKEDFKRALSKCFKEMWIMHSQENFNLALEWNKNKVLQFNIDGDINDSDDFDSSASAIDLFETYFSIFESENNEGYKSNQELRELWKRQWVDQDDENAENIDGFDLLKFEGESIVDGNLVGEAAKQYFAFKNIEANLKREKPLKSFDLSGLPFKTAVEKTKELINSKEYEYLFEAAFEYDNFNLKTRCDVLKISAEQNHCEIIEIKATSSVKVEHFYDLMYQYFILKNNNLTVKDIAIGHIRDNYIRGQEFNPISSNLSDQCSDLMESMPLISFEECLAELDSDISPENYGEPLDLDFDGFFNIDKLSFGKAQNRLNLIDLLANFEKQFSINDIIKNITNLLAKSEAEILAIMKDDCCQTVIKKSPRGNDFKENKEFADDETKKIYCHHVLKYYDKNKENIFNFTILNKQKKAMIYNQTGKIYLEDFTSLYDNDIPTKPKDGSTLFNEANFRHFEVYKKFIKGKESFQDKDIIYHDYISKIEEFLEIYQKFPIYMYDFETVKWAIPKYNQSKSYQQIPFQYSVDVMVDEKYDYNKPESMIHYDFLANTSDDPRPDFIKKFLKDIFSQGPGIYVAYNDAFEKMVLKQLALLFPKYRKSLFYIIQNTIDLMDFFKGNSKREIPWFLIYHPNFHGSYSIKKTQPALDYNFSYSDLAINKGDKASQTFREFSDGNINKKIWEDKIRPDMIKYCNRDTLAMVVVIQRIKEIVEKYKKELNNEN